MHVWARRAEDVLADVRYAARLCLRAPVFTFVAVLTIGLAIGMNAAVFSVVNAVLLKTLPVRDADRLVFINVAAANGAVRGAPPYPCYERFGPAATGLSGLAAFTFDLATITVDGQPERVMAQRASTSYFDVLGVPPVLGRTFAASDARLDPPVAVLGYQYWQRRFGGAPDVLGRTITYQNRLFTVMGVTPPDFTGLEPGIVVDITVPIDVVGPATLNNAGRWWFDAVGRLRDGASRDQAAAQVDTVFQAFMQERAATPEDRKRAARMVLTPAMRGMQFLRSQFSEPLLFLMGIAGLVLLIACANVANLLLARAVARRHEFATRVAIGASSTRLVRQLLAEALFVGIMGTAAGLVLARWLLAAIAGSLGAGVLLPVAVTLNLSPDGRVVAFSALLCLGTSLLFGLAPALRAARTDPVTDLKERGRIVSGRRRFGLTSATALVVVQVALSLVLLVTTSLLITTVTKLRAVDLGFQADGVSTFEIELLPTAGARDPLTRWRSVLDGVQRLPGVRAASLSWLMPLGTRDRSVGIRIPGADAAGRQTPGAVLNHVSPDFFATMGIPVNAGRAFAPRDDDHAPLVAIINQTAARAYFGNANPIGQHLEVGSAVREIVGVAADSKHVSLRDDPPRVVYLPVFQPLDRMNSLTLAVRAGEGAGALADAVRREVGTLGSDIFLGRATTLRQQIDRALLRERFMSTVSAAFGALGVLLAAVGLFGVMSFTMQRRKHEMAMRLALGATAADLRWRVLRQAISIAAIGIVCGVPIALVAARFLSRVLFGVQPANILILIGCAVTLLAVAAFAAYVPAQRASRVDPIAGLRAD